MSAADRKTRHWLSFRQHSTCESSHSAKTQPTIYGFGVSGAAILSMPKKTKSPASAASLRFDAVRPGLALPTAFWTTDAGLRITAVDGNGLSALGLAADDIVGVPLHEYLGGFLQNEIILTAHERVLNGESLCFESRLGDHRVEINLAPRLESNGSVIGIFGMAKLIRQDSPEGKVEIHEGHTFRALLEKSADIVALVNQECVVTFLSQPIERVLGYPPEEFIGKSGFAHIHPEDEPRAREMFLDVISTPERVRTAEYRARAKDKSWKQLEVTGTNFLEDPEIRAVVVNFRDITERKRVEAERQVMMEIIQALNITSNLDELLCRMHRALKTVVSAENCIVALHDDATGMFHFPFVSDLYDAPPPPQKAGRTCSAYVFRTGKPLLASRKDFAELVARGEIDMVGTPSAAWLGVPLKTPTGKIGVLVVQSYVDENAYCDRDVEMLVSVAAQIALAIERKRSEQELRKREEEHSIIFNAAPGIIVCKDRESRILQANQAAAQFFGLPAEKMQGMHISELLPDLEGASEREDREVMATGEPRMGHVTTRRAGKEETRILQTHRLPYRDLDGKIAGVIVFATDITEQQQAKTILRESETRYRLLVENAAYGIFRTSPDGKFLDANHALATMLGYGSKEELLKVNIRDSIYANPEQRAPMISHTIAEGHLNARELEWKRKDGKSVIVRLSARRVRGADGEICFEGVVENVTEWRALETQLRQAQKMEAVGRLAGGVAHDFNNLLMVIKGHSELLLERTSTEHPDFRKIDQIKKAADRAAGLTRQLLAFSRMQVMQPRVMDLNITVTEMGKMLPRLIGEDIDLSILIKPDLGRVKADPGQMEQIILNLAVNARDAMPDGGKLLIETMNVDLDEEYARIHPPTVPGRFVMLAVTDTGAGMDADTQAHIFEPFFTTKEKGKGTGLGLATVYGVVKQSGGYVWVYSELGKGTAFKIYLPRVDETPETERDRKRMEELPRGSGAILLAEDEKEVREVAREFLGMSGYTVIEAKDGVEAIEIATSHKGTIDLLLTDMVMPGMNGRELAASLTSMRPSLKVIFMSGYTEYASVRNEKLERDKVLLQKPFTRAVLVQAVRDVLAKGK